MNPALQACPNNSLSNLIGNLREQNEVLNLQKSRFQGQFALFEKTLLTIIAENQCDLMSELLTKKINANIRIQESDNSPAYPLIYHVVKKGFLPMVRIVVNHGANIRAFNPDDQSGDDTAILTAILKDDAPIVCYLLSNGANANGVYRDRNITFLALAALQRNVEIMKSLVAGGAKVGRAINSLDNHFQKIAFTPKSPEQRLQDEIIYREALKLLFDFATGVDLDNLNFLKNMDLTGFCFYGVSTKGTPISREQLNNCGFRGFNKTIIGKKNLEELAQKDLERCKLIQAVVRKRGVERGEITRLGQEAVNLVPTRKLIIKGSLRELQLRFNYFPQSCYPNKYSIEGDKKLTRLQWAILGGNNEIVQLLLKMDADLTLPAFYERRQFSTIKFAKLLGRIGVINALEEASQPDEYSA